MSFRSTAIHYPADFAFQQRPARLSDYRRGTFSGTKKLDRRIALFPIVFFEAFLTFTVLLFTFGPWPWQVSNPIELYGFLALAQTGLLVGYLSAINGRPRTSFIKWPPSKLVVISLLFNFVWLIQIYKFRTNTVEFDLGAALRAVTTGLSNPAAQYFEKNQGLSRLGATTNMAYLTFLVYPILWILIPLGIVYWHRLTLWTRIGLVIWIICDLMSWTASGMNKGIADYTILLPWLMIAGRPSVLVTWSWRKMLLIAMSVLLGTGCLLVFFSANMLGRAGGQTVSQYDAPAGIAVDAENPLIRFLPPSEQGLAASFISYLTQGYYALSLALREPFVFTYGIGNSYFLEGLSRRYVNSPVIDRTYPARIETYGWSRYGRWHSFYTWIASDVTFLGTIFVMFLIGRLLASVWLSVVFYQDPVATSLLALLIIMLFYTSANNQVLGFATTAIPFWVLLFLWLFPIGRGRKNSTRYV